MTAQKSSYGAKKSWNADKKGSNVQERKPTTHYAYMLNKDEEGNFSKEFINTVFIDEQEGQFGSYLKLNVRGPVPEGTIFIQRKKDA